MLRGRSVYESALADPDSIADWLKKRERIEGEDWTDLAFEIYEVKTDMGFPGWEYPLVSPTGDENMVEFPETWPKAFPKLMEGHWEPRGRIRFSFYVVTRGEMSYDDEAGYHKFPELRSKEVTDSAMAASASVARFAACANADRALSMSNGTLRLRAMSWTEGNACVLFSGGEIGLPRG